MRALAVALVVLYHANIPGVHGGFFGVDVFFVISGFVITNVLLRERASKGTTSIPGFYARRIRRILPAATVVLIATVFATYHWLSYIAGAMNANDAKYVAAFVGNFHFATAGNSIFHGHRSRPRRCSSSGHWPSRSSFISCGPLLFLLITRPWKKIFLRSPRLMTGLTIVIAALARLVHHRDPAKRSVGLLFATDPSLGAGPRGQYSRWQARTCAGRDASMGESSLESAWTHRHPAVARGSI